MNGSKLTGHGPQGKALFRLIALVTRFQLGAQHRAKGDVQVYAVVYAMLAGALALGTITMAAVVTDLPLLFPPLAPSAFILFYTPMAVAASPRNVITAHTLAVLSGLCALNLMTMLMPAADLLDPTVMNWGRVATIALAMGLVSGLMTVLEVAHPPAAASAIIAAMGYLGHPSQSAGLVGAAILLALGAFLMNRVLGGLPYPRWRADPAIARSFGVLAGLPGCRGNHWQEMALRILHRR